MADASRQVLFVEDTSDTRDLVEFSLRSEGFEVMSAQTANEGLSLARTNTFALILLDIGLPDKDGLELCREIRRFDQTTPILFYTAFLSCLIWKRRRKRARKAVSENLKTRHGSAKLRASWLRAASWIERS